jgi:hypothetical protein
MKSIGAALIDLDDSGFASKESMSSFFEEYLVEVPPGRSVFFVWTVAVKFQTQINWEFLLGSVALGNPNTRNDQATWLFASNGALRMFDRKLRYSKTVFWAEIRKTGERAYSRRKTIPEAMLMQSRIPVEDPSFTRDVANNVWHVLDKSNLSEIVARIRALSIWPDELLMHVSRGVRKNLSWKPLDLTQAVIPKATKHYYPFFENTLF